MYDIYIYLYLCIYIYVKKIKRYLHILYYHITFKLSNIRKSQGVLELTPTPMEDRNLGQIHPMFNIDPENLWLESYGFLFWIVFFFNLFYEISGPRKKDL